MVPLSSLALITGSGPSPYLSPASSSASGAATKEKISSSAKDFESILLTQWLQAAESSFATVPAEDSDEDQGGEQLKSFGVQVLAKALSNVGGIGIGEVVKKALDHKQLYAPSLHATEKMSR